MPIQTAIPLLRTQYDEFNVTMSIVFPITVAMATANLVGREERWSEPLSRSPRISKTSPHSWSWRLLLHRYWYCVDTTTVVMLVVVCCIDIYSTRVLVNRQGHTTTVSSLCYVSSNCRNGFWDKTDTYTPRS